MPLQYKLEYIAQLLKECNGNKSEVARRLGKSQANMYKYYHKMNKAGILDDKLNLKEQ